MTALVVAEAFGGHLHSGVAHAIAAAQAFGEVDVVVFSNQTLAVPFTGIRRVWQVTDESLKNPTPDSILPTLGALADEYSHFIAAHSTFGRSVMARLAARLRAPMFSDVVAIQGNNLTRPCYAGALHEVLQLAATRAVITVRPASFTPVVSGRPASAETAPFICGVINAKVTGTAVAISARPDLTTAKHVVAGGRGLGSKESFALVEDLADALGAAVGASRAAVDAGFIGNDYQVGQTGKTVAPQVYVALGISGAVQHLAGIKGAKNIVAVNKDPNAPIFKMADYGLVADLFEVVPQLLNELKNRKNPL